MVVRAAMVKAGMVVLVVVMAATADRVAMPDRAGRAERVAT